MSVLAKIRNRAGLLVTIIGIALGAFILNDALGSGKFLFGDSGRNVGKIAGKEIPYDEFNYKVQQAIENQKRSSGQNTLDEFTQEMIVQQTWNAMLNDIVMKKEYQLLGLGVSDNELLDLMLGKHPHPFLIRNLSDQETGQIIPSFADPNTGGLSMAKLYEFTQQMNQEQEAGWAQLEAAIKEMRISEKYNNLIKKGLYVTATEAKRDIVDKKKNFSIKYVVKKYSAVPDTAVSVSESEIKSYYNKHQNQYKQENSIRKIEYLAWDISYSNQDELDVQQEINRIAEEFKAKEVSEDSSFVSLESDTREFDKTYYKEGTLSPSIDSVMFNSPIGTIVGPYKENNTFKVAKLIDLRPLPDSVNARHILIKPVNGDMVAAKEKADSLKKIVNSKNFADMAASVSEDEGSAIKGGDLDWFTEGQMVQPFNDAAFLGKKGDIVTVESQFGIHIIEILDQGPKTNRVQVAVIEKNIEPSSTTFQKIYSLAAQFAGKNNTAALFGKAADEQGLNKRVAEVNEKDKNIPGLESPKELIRWALSADADEVSAVFELGRKFVIARLVEIKDKGTLPLEFVRDEVEQKVRQEKKGEKIVNEFNTSIQGINSIDAFSNKVNLPVLTMENLTFSSNSIPGSGREEKVVGVVTTLSPDKLSIPIQGNTGVFVVQVSSVTEAPSANDLGGEKAKLAENLQARVGYELFEALKENAGVIDNRSRFY